MHSKFYGYLTSLTFYRFFKHNNNSRSLLHSEFLMKKIIHTNIILHANCKLHLLLQNRCPSSVVGLTFLISVLEHDFIFCSVTSKKTVLPEVFFTNMASLELIRHDLLLWHPVTVTNFPVYGCNKLLIAM